MFSCTSDDLTQGTNQEGKGAVILTSTATFSRAMLNYNTNKFYWNNEDALAVKVWGASSNTEPADYKFIINNYDEKSPSANASFICAEAPSAASKIIVTYPSSYILKDGEKEFTIETTFTQFGKGTNHLKNMMFMYGSANSYNVKLNHLTSFLKFSLNNNEEDSYTIKKVTLTANDGATIFGTKGSLNVATDGTVTSSYKSEGRSAEIAVNLSKEFTLEKGESIDLYALTLEGEDFTDKSFTITVSGTKDITKTINCNDIKKYNGGETSWKPGKMYSFDLRTNSEGMRISNGKLLNSPRTSYFEIRSLKDLKMFRDSVNNVNETNPQVGVTLDAKLLADIDLQSIENWEPIGYSASNLKLNYSGVFDGNGHTISNLKITNKDKKPSGFFGIMNNSSVVNRLIIDKATISDTKTYNYDPATSNNVSLAVGGLVGVVKGTLKGCVVKNSTIKGVSIVGGIAGYCNAGIIACSSINNQVSSTSESNYCGEIAGVNNFKIYGCYCDDEFIVGYNGVKVVNENKRIGTIQYCQLKNNKVYRNKKDYPETGEIQTIIDNNGSDVDMNPGIDLWNETGANGSPLNSNSLNYCPFKWSDGELVQE